MNPLTRKADVLAVLQAGGFALVDRRDVGHGLAHLFDATGAAVPAWQNAVKACLSRCIVTDQLPAVRRWELRR